MPNVYENQGEKIVKTSIPFFILPSNKFVKSIKVQFSCKSLDWLITSLCDERSQTILSLQKIYI